MKFIKFSLFITGIFLLFSIVPLASAHRPDEGNLDGVTAIPNPDTSFAYYREIDNTSPVHLYTFDGKAGDFFHAGINIPQISGLEDYQVSLALLGPGLPGLEESEQTNASHSHTGVETVAHEHESQSSYLPLPAGYNLEQLGGLVVENRPGEDFFEPFTQTRYWGRQELDFNLPETGKYYLLVWNPEGEGGKYVLDTGTEEVFGPADLLRFPIWWLNTRLYFEQGPSLVGAASILFFGIGGLVIYRVRKK